MQRLIPSAFVSTCFIRGWREAATARSSKRAAAERALMHWGHAWLARAFNTWSAQVQESREMEGRAQELLAGLWVARARRAVGWWHDYAQYIHHHRCGPDFGGRRMD